MPVPTEAPRVQRSLARDDAYRLIREWIIAGQLAPGERIQDAALAEALGVSRMPIREALLWLQNEGLVESSANRWIRVTEVRADQGEELYPIVWALEAMALRRPAVASIPVDLAAMEDANARLAGAIDAGDGPRATEADATFHHTFLEAAGNQELMRIVSEVKVKLRRLEVAYFAGNLKAVASVDEHRTILDALKRSDFEAAAAAVEANWRGSLQRFRQQLGAIEGGRQPGGRGSGLRARG